MHPENQTSLMTANYFKQEGPPALEIPEPRFSFWRALAAADGGK